MIILPSSRSCFSRFAWLAVLRGSGRGKGYSFQSSFLSTKSPSTTARHMATMQSSSSNTDTKMPSPAYAWSITASLVDGSVQIQPTQSISTDFDVSQSTEWMEYLEQQESRQDDVGGAGAYDTMRCDLVLEECAENSKNKTKIWGKDYHLQRLQESYKSLLQASNMTIDHQQLAKAMESSKTILQRLLQEAETSSVLKKALGQNLAYKALSKDTYIQLLRVTLLWSTPKAAANGELPGTTPSQSQHEDDNNSTIVVRGHACSSTKPIRISACPDPISASVAVHSTKSDSESHHHTRHDAIVDESLPTRHDNPQSKIASWCRLRKAMENPNTFKPPGTGEVLMVRQRIDVDGKLQLEVLEGLSSNFFVIDKHGSLRTATEGVLHGYVRHLVLESAEKCGIPFDPRPIYLQGANSEWKEAFITSSSRLLYPISKVLLPEDHNHNDVDANVTANSSSTIFVEFWEDPWFEGDWKVAGNDHVLQKKNANAVPKWQLLLNEILQARGYS